MDTSAIRRFLGRGRKEIRSENQLTKNLSTFSSLSFMFLEYENSITKRSV